MLRLLVVLAVTALSLSAVTLKALKFEGLIHLSPEIAKEIINIHPGEPVDVKKVDDAIKKLFKQGYFKDIWVTEAHGDVTFHFKEKPVISKIEFSGYGENKKEELDTLIHLKKGDIFDDARIEAAKERIKEKLAAEGYFDTVVEAQSTVLEGGSVRVKFITNKGENIIIRRMKLCGAESFDQDDIESVMANRERDFMGWLWGLNDGKAKIDQLEYDGARIKDWYMRHGYLDCRVSTPLMRVDFNDYNAELDFKVDEGTVYTVKKIEIFLQDPVIEEAQLREELSIETGDVFNIEKIRKDMEILRTRIADLGYAFVRVMPDFSKDEKVHTSVVKFMINPGKKVYVRDVVISGNSRTLDRVIRREVFLAPGDLYSLTDMKDSKSALSRTGYFDNVVIDERRVSEDQIDLVVNVVEAKTGNLMFGGGYGSYDGFLLNASVTDRNVFGSGLQTSVSFDLSKRRHYFNVSLTNPRLWDGDWSGSINLFNSSYESYDYTDKRLGAGITVGRQIARHWRLGLGYQIFRTQLSGFPDDYIPTEIQRYEDSFLTSALTPTISFNNTDDYYLPRSGMVAGLSFQYAGVGGDARFNKNLFNFTYFKGLRDYIDYDLILRYKFRGGAIAYDDELPVSEKFFIGGVRSIRGYQSGSISPRYYPDPNSKDYYLTGGKYTLSNSIEASIPLIEAAKMRLAFFYDYGMIGEVKPHEMVKSGTGVAIEWFSPMGLINLIFARPLMREQGDRTSNFEFTMGTQF